MIAVTGANGKLGRLAIQELIKKGVSAKDIVAGVRSPEKAQEIAALGVQVRKLDYDKPETILSALQAVDRLLLISSSEIGKRESQHRSVISAAKSAGVKRVVYTSILKADSSRLALAAEHLATERFLRDSGLGFTILRNGWYLENHTENLGAALEHGVILGAAGEGRFSSASRSDYAAAAAAVVATPLSSTTHDGKVYELAGENAFTLSELAAVVGRVAGKPVVYKNLSGEELEKTLVSFGLPGPFAHILADSDLYAAKGDLEIQSNDLARLSGRAGQSLESAVTAAVRR